MWSMLFGSAQEAKQSLLNNSSPSYNTMSALPTIEPKPQATEDDILVNLISSFIEEKCTERAYKAVNIAITEMQKRLNAEKKISTEELQKAINSFSAAKKILLEDREWYGLALFGKLNIASRIDQMITALEARKASTHTSAVSSNTYQQS